MHILTPGSCGFLGWHSVINNSSHRDFLNLWVVSISEILLYRIQLHISSAVNYRSVKWNRLLVEARQNERMLQWIEAAKKPSINSSPIQVQHNQAIMPIDSCMHWSSCRLYSRVNRIDLSKTTVNNLLMYSTRIQGWIFTHDLKSNLLVLKERGKVNTKLAYKETLSTSFEDSINIFRLQIPFMQ